MNLLLPVVNLVRSASYCPHTLQMFRLQGQFPYSGRTEVAPDLKQKFLQRLQLVQQQNHGSPLLSPSAGSKQQNSLLQQVASVAIPVSSFIRVHFVVGALGPLDFMNSTQLNSTQRGMFRAVRKGSLNWCRF